MGREAALRLIVLGDDTFILYGTKTNPRAPKIQEKAFPGTLAIAIG
jgi:hypothetical protein